MYPNLDGEMARFKITRGDLARRIGITPTTLSLKLNGKSNLSLKECVEIKEAIASNKTIDYLFKVFDEEKIS